MMKLFFGMLLLGGATVAAAQVGSQGKDWDQQTLTLKNGAVVLVTAQVTTRNTQSGNKSSVVLFVDGAEVDRAGGERAEHTLTYTLRGDGQRTVLAKCSNERADADKCTLKFTQSGGAGGGVFDGGKS